MKYTQNRIGKKNHPKFRHLKKLLNIEKAQAIGHHDLFVEWVGQQRPDGILKEFDLEAAAMEEGAEWKGDYRVFIHALIESQLLDQKEDGTYYVHNWHKYSPMIRPQLPPEFEAKQQRDREADRLRQARSRANRNKRLAEAEEFMLYGRKIYPELGAQKYPEITPKIPLPPIPPEIKKDPVSDLSHGTMSHENVTRDSRVTHAPVTRDITLKSVESLNNEQLVINERQIDGSMSHAESRLSHSYLTLPYVKEEKDKDPSLAFSSNDEEKSKAARFGDSDPPQNGEKNLTEIQEWVGAFHDKKAAWLKQPKLSKWKAGYLGKELGAIREKQHTPRAEGLQRIENFFDSKGPWIEQRMQYSEKCLIDNWDALAKGPLPDFNEKMKGRKFNAKGDFTRYDETIHKGRFRKPTTFDDV